MNNVEISDSRLEAARTWHVFVLLIVVLAVAAGELTLSATRELWLDESHTAHVITLPLSQLVQFTRGDTHPPLYFVLLAAWTRIWGEREIGLRSLSMLAHIASVPVAYSVARRLWASSRTALLTAMLVALNPAWFYYGSEARMYSLVAFFTLASFWCVVEARSAGARIGWSIAAAVLGAAAIYTSYLGLFALAAIYAVWLLTARRAPRRVLVSGALLALFVVPWLPTVARQKSVKRALDAAAIAARANPEALNYQTAPASNSRGRSPVSLTANLVSAAGVVPPGKRALLPLVLLPFVVLFGAATRGVVRGDFAALTSAAVIVATLAGLLALNVDARRYFFATVPFLMLLLVVGYESLSSLRWRSVNLANFSAGLCLLAYVYGDAQILRTKQERPTDAVARQVAMRAASGDLVIFNGPSSQVPFDYYARRYGLKARETGFPISIEDWWRRQPFKGWGGPNVTRSDLNTFLQTVVPKRPDGSAIWLVLFETRYFDPKNLLLDSLSRRALAATEIVPCPGPAGCDPWRVIRLQF